VKRTADLIITVCRPFHGLSCERPRSPSTEVLGYYQSSATPT